MWNTVWYSLPRVLLQPSSPSSLSLPTNSEIQTINSCHKSWFFSKSAYWFWTSAVFNCSLILTLPARAGPCLQAASPPRTDPLGYLCPGAGRQPQALCEGRAGLPGPTQGSHSIPQGSTRFQKVPAGPGKPGGRARRAFYHHLTVLRGNATFTQVKSVLPITVTVKGSPCLYLSPRASSSWFLPPSHWGGGQTTAQQAAGTTPSFSDLVQSLSFGNICSRVCC